MTDLHPLAGVYAAAVTPLRAGSGLDPDSLPDLLRFLASRGCHGALLFGTTGEGPSFSPREREALMRAAAGCLDELPGFRLFAGTGTPSLSETIELTKLTFDLGFRAALTLPPYFFRKAGDEGLFQWFREVIRQAVPSDGFLLGYHIPGTSGVGLSIGLLRRLKEAFPRQFAGIKDSSGEAEHARTLGAEFGGELLVFTGTDSFLQLAMQNGAQGCITAPANLLSPDLRAVWEARAAGPEADSLQALISEKRRVLESRPPYPAVLKSLLHRLHGLPRWNVRAPLEDLSPHVEDELLQAYAALETKTPS